MARTKQNPNIGKYIAMYEGDVNSDPEDRPILHDTPEAALEYTATSGLDDGDVIYVYALVGVKVVRKPTLTENFAG